MSNSDLLAVFALTVALLLLFALLALPNPAKSRDVRPLVRHDLRQLAHHQLRRLDHRLVHLVFILKDSYLNVSLAPLLAFSFSALPTF